MAVSTEVSLKTKQPGVIGETPAWRRVLVRVLIYALLIGFALFEFLPFLWSITTSFKSEQEINAGFVNGFHWIPQNFTLNNYLDIFNKVEFGRWFFNSLIVGVITTLFTLAFSSTSGYAFARIPFPGRDFIFWCIVATQMVPAIIYLVPIYILLKNLNLLDTLPGLIIPFMVTNFGIFLMRQFFTSVPVELEEAARVDGAGRFRTFAQVVLPLAKPALAALTIFTFMGRWNDFLLPLIIINSPDKYTLPLGMSTFRGLYKTDWGLLMSGSLLVMVPIVIMFVFFQRFFIEGVSYTGLKG
ncbi:MAG: binding-protein-dependent transport system inner rane protein [Chloroflexi bacterium]|jgi:multiple sugar transport system permease protein|nr:binding-protein-dependent transport system inner rane protein [Chloroflexota bacterium]